MLLVSGLTAFVSLVQGMAAEAPAPQTNTVGMKMMPIQPGEFVMGRNGTREESPAHKVKITRPFALAATEVTRGQWKAVMGAEPPTMGLKDQTDQHPVVGITWFEAVEFCKKLSAKEGKTYRLPTEAEWEYACRAGTTTAYSYSDKADLNKMICAHDPPRSKDASPPRTRGGPAPAGSMSANAWGLHDMHGNAHEWCYDWFDGESYLQTLLTRFMDGLPKDERPKWANPEKIMRGDGRLPEERPKWSCGFRPDYPTGEEIARKITPRLAKALERPLVDPLGPPRGQADKRAIRGGGWGQTAGHCRSTSRFGADPLWRNQAIGLRVVCETEPGGPATLMKFPAPPAEVEIPGQRRFPEVVVTPAGMRFILVRPGAFLMGVTPEDAKRLEECGFHKKGGNPIDPIPQRRVIFTKPFYLASTIYTRMTTALTGAGAGLPMPHLRELPPRFYADTHVPALEPPAHPRAELQPMPYEMDRPDTEPLYDAVDRLLVMSLHDGRDYRLPSLMEMEYATRAGTTTTWYWGNDPTVYFDFEFYGGNGEGDVVRHVGRKLPNPWGFYDMLCNSTQWTSTPLDAKEKLPAQMVDPLGDPIGRPTSPGTVYTILGGAYRYGWGCCGGWGMKFGNYRNCSRIGGFRAAFDAVEFVPKPVDEAWQKRILALRVANFLAGGNYGLTWGRRGVNRSNNGTEGSGTDAARCFAKALSLDPDCEDARIGLRRIRDELWPYIREKSKESKEPGKEEWLATRFAEVAKEIAAILAKYPQARTR